MTLVAERLRIGRRLADVSAMLRPGEVTAICGPNGAGKSTLLSCLAGLLQPDSGRVELDGEGMDLLPPRHRARRIGYLPQTPEVAWDVSVETLVALGRLPWQGAPLHRAHAAADDDAAAVEEALTALDLADLRHRPVSRISGGERARAHIARVLAGRPAWILADEPLAGLDLAHAATLIAQLKQQAAAGAGVVLVLHDLAMAMNHADRVLVLERGALAADGPPAEALSEAVIARVWGVAARWLGERSEHALALAGGATIPGLIPDCRHPDKA
jgi:iron complex transport system ATP-binding protein